MWEAFAFGFFTVLGGFCAIIALMAVLGVVAAVAQFIFGWD